VIKQHASSARAIAFAVGTAGDGTTRDHESGQDHECQTGWFGHVHKKTSEVPDAEPQSVPATAVIETRTTRKLREETVKEQRKPRQQNPCSSRDWR
jgi:hypothetical protein